MSQVSDVSMINDTADIGIALGKGEACGQREKNWSGLGSSTDFGV